METNMETFIVSYTSLKGELLLYEVQAKDENHAESIALEVLGSCKINWICAENLKA